jgi:hypothetical protein
MSAQRTQAKPADLVALALDRAPIGAPLTPAEEGALAALDMSAATTAHAVVASKIRPTQPE